MPSSTVTSTANEAETDIQLTAEQRVTLAQLAEDAYEYVQSLPHDMDGLQYYVVGGAVRDALIGAPWNDLDFVVENATAQELLDRGFRDINASSFGVLHDANREEWALTRTETKPDDAHGYKGIEVDTDGVSLREDLRRRDLRMNSMALLLTGGVPSGFNDDEVVQIPETELDAVLIDPFNGRSDIAHGVIRPTSDAFSEDPIRVLRAARYAARYVYIPPAVETDEPRPFEITSAAETAMRHVAPELNRMSRDRIGEEIVKAMKQASDPTRFWDVLQDVGALAVLAPKLDRASIVPAGPEPYHREGDTYTHTMMVLTEMHDLCESRDITGLDRVRRYMMTIAHDLGKVTLADEQGGLWSDDPPRRFGGHADVGIEDAARLAARLGLDGHLEEVMQDASEFHMDIHDLPDWEPMELVAFVDDHDPDEQAETPYMATLDELVDLAQADHQGRWQSRDEHPDTSGYEEAPEAPDGAVRPVFRRERFSDPIDRAREVIQNITGFTALRDGLCEEHGEAGLENEDLAAQLAQCDKCRTPGPWVGETLAERRHEFMTRHE